MNCRVLLFSAVCLCWVSVRPASAAFFDNSGGKMDISNWVAEYDDKNLVSYINGDHTLGFSGTIPESEDEGWVDIHSTWSLSLSQDFIVSTGFHADHLGTDYSGSPVPGDYNKVASYLQLIQANDTLTDSLRSIALEVKNDLHSDSGIAWNAYMLGAEVDTSLEPINVAIDPSTPANNWGNEYEQRYWWERDSVDGTLMYAYDAETDMLMAIMKDDDGNVVARSKFDNFKESTGSSELYVSLGVWAVPPATFTEEEINFYNFQVLEGPDLVVTPEPASMLLFGIGGAAMAFARRRKTTKA